jgi:hypothetical protein
MKGMKPMWGRWGWVGWVVALMAALAGLGSGGRGLGALAQGGSNVELVGQIGGAVLRWRCRGGMRMWGWGRGWWWWTWGIRPVRWRWGGRGCCRAWCWDVAVSGTYAYVADGDSGSSGDRCFESFFSSGGGFYDTPGYASGVAVSGTYAYVADVWEGLRVIDVSNPSSPREVGAFMTRRGMPVAWRSRGRMPMWRMGMGVFG